MSRERLIPVALAAGLAAIAATTYASTTGFPFVAYDDDIRLLSNPAVRAGVTWEAITCAFTSMWDANWSPLTWVSHMLDFSLYAADAGGHHAMNVALHATNVALVFLALRAVRGESLGPALVALLLAIHPIHVETVAWISERKGLLSSTFAFAALWCHASDLGRDVPRHRALSLFLFALGLMAKPMLVSLPFVVLLLGRLAPAPAQGRDLRRELRALWPWFALAAVSVAITLGPQQQGGAIREFGALPLLPRIANALVASVLYLGKLVWPVDLAPFYPHPNLPGGTPWTALQVLGAAGFWAVVGALLAWSRQRTAAIGVAWYWITLLPVIGLVQVGNQAMADRYAYLPAIGIYLAVVCTFVDALRGAPKPLGVAAGTAAAVGIGTLFLAAQDQIAVWRSSETLFRHSAAVTDANYSMHFNLANTLKRKGRIEEAIEHYRIAIEIYPGMARAHFNLANTLAAEGRVDEAATHYRAALAVIPDLQAARNALGRILVQRGDLAGSLAHYREEVARQPRSLAAQITLGHLLRMSGDLAGAADAYEAAAELSEDGERWRREARAVRAQLAETRPDG